MLPESLTPIQKDGVDLEEAALSAGRPLNPAVLRVLQQCFVCHPVRLEPPLWLEIQQLEREAHKPSVDLRTSLLGKTRAVMGTTHIHGSSLSE